MRIVRNEGIQGLFKGWSAQVYAGRLISGHPLSPLPCPELEAITAKSVPQQPPSRFNIDSHFVSAFLSAQYLRLGPQTMITFLVMERIRLLVGMEAF